MAEFSDLQVCDHCVDRANVWIGCDVVDYTQDPVTMIGVAWGKIPGVESIIESIADSTATERRSDDTEGSFVLPSCASTSRTRTFAVVSQYCQGFHPKCYGKEGDIVYIRTYSTKDADGNPDGEFREFKARLNYPARSWDNTTDDPELLNWSFESVGTVLDGGLATCDANTPAALLLANGYEADPADPDTIVTTDPNDPEAGLQNFPDEPVTTGGLGNDTSGPTN